MAKFSKRVYAYIIDIIIVYIIASIITGFIPISEKAENLLTELNNTFNLVTEKKVNLNEYTQRLEDITYEISHETVVITIVEIVVYILYFNVLPYYNNGQTLGKKLIKIRITSSDEKSPSLNNYLFRSFILNGIGAKIILLALIVTVSKANYILANNIIEYLQIGIIIAILLMIIIRKDKRGLHDLIANTKVVEE